MHATYRTMETFLPRFLGNECFRFLENFVREVGNKL